MTSNPNINILTQSELLDLSMSIGQSFHFEENAKNFTDCLIKSLNLSACEIWMQSELNDNNFTKAFFNTDQILNNISLAFDHPVIQMMEDQCCQIITINKAKKGKLENLTDIECGVVYSFRLSPSFLLIAWDKNAEAPIPKSELSVLLPLFKRFGVCLAQNISDSRLKKLETDVQISEDELHKYKNVVDNMSEGLIIINLDGIIVFANEAMTQISEFTQEDMLGHHVAEIRVNENFTKMIQTILNRAFKGKTSSFAIEHKKKNSQSAWWSEGTIAPYRNAIGKIVGAIAHVRDITKEHLTRLALKDSQDRLTRIFDLTPIPVLIRSIDNLNFKMVNKKFTELFGYTVEDLNVLNRKDLVYDEDSSTIKQKMDQLKSGEISVFRMEKRYIKKDGSVFWGAASRSLVKFEDETLLIGFIEDITAQKEAIAALKESEAKVRAILNSTNDKILSIDTDFNLIEYNKAAKKFLNKLYKNRKIKPGIPFIYYSEVKDSWIQYFEKVLQGEDFILTREYTLNDAKRIDLVNLLPIKDENDVVIGITLYGRDITELTKAQQKIEESNKRYEDLFNNMYDALITTGKDGYIVNANAAAQRLLEYPLKELKKIQIPMIVDPRDAEKSARFLEKLKTEGFYSNYQGRIITKKGNVKFVQVNSNAIIKDGEMIGSRDIVRDITALKEAEQHREKLYDQLEYANKELKDFAYIVSHDLKAPLRAISSLAGWIAEDNKDHFDEEGKRNLDLLIGRSNRMQNFIEGILHYSRLGRIQIEPEPVKIKAIIKEVLEDIDPPMDKFSFQIDPNIPEIHCEKIRISQVFQNLITNAIKYHDKEKGIIKIYYEDQEEFHKFTIEDDGPGIEKRHFEKVFQIFQTLQSRDQMESTGIGLTIVKRIVELHGGKVSLESEPGQYSKFSFTLLK